MAEAAATTEGLGPSTSWLDSQTLTEFWCWCIHSTKITDTFTACTTKSTRGQ